jgi:DNA modification methylase
MADVVKGSLWEIGEHIFLCGDSLDPSNRVKLFECAGLEKVDFVYTDAPWNQGNLNYFYNRADYANVEFGWFIESIIDMLAIHDVVVMDMGEQWIDLVVDYVTKSGKTILWHKRTKYAGGYCRTFAYSSNAALVGIGEIEDGLYGAQVIKAVMNLYAPISETYFDPCCGKLVYVKQAAKVGLRCLGIEIIPEKLAAGLAGFSKWLGKDAVRIL